MIKNKQEYEKPVDYGSSVICKYKEEGYCKASLTQNPVIPCEYADYNAKSYYPPCSKVE